MFFFPFQALVVTFNWSLVDSRKISELSFSVSGVHSGKWKNIPFLLLLPDYSLHTKRVTRGVCLGTLLRNFRFPSFVGVFQPRGTKGSPTLRFNYLEDQIMNSIGASFLELTLCSFNNHQLQYPTTHNHKCK